MSSYNCDHSTWLRMPVRYGWFSLCKHLFLYNHYIFTRPKLSLFMKNFSHQVVTNLIHVNIYNEYPQWLVETCKMSSHYSFSFCPDTNNCELAPNSSISTTWCWMYFLVEILIILSRMFMYLRWPPTHHRPTPSPNKNTLRRWSPKKSFQSINNYFSYQIVSSVTWCKSLLATFSTLQNDEFLFLIIPISRVACTTRNWLQHVVEGYRWFTCLSFVD